MVSRSVRVRQREDGRTPTDDFDAAQTRVDQVLQHLAADAACADDKDSTVSQPLSLLLAEKPVQHIGIVQARRG